MSISKNEVRKGDKLRVTWTDRDVEFQMIAVADKQDRAGDWKTREGAWVVASEWRKNEKIELLERPKTPEEILAERRDKLSEEVCGHPFSYQNLSQPSKKLVNHIIKLEDNITKLEEKKEALTK